jgi:isocitrate dehydrogenase
MTKIVAPSMVYIKGEEMTRYTMNLILEQWIFPYVDTSAWEYYDLSAKYRDDTQDKVLADTIDAGNRIRSIFKEPTITPTQDQLEYLGIKKAWGSPNGAIRRGWNGVTISRDTIMVDGLELGYAKPVFFERQAIGGEYGGGFAKVGKGKSVTTFYPEDGGEPLTVDERTLSDNENSIVTYHNPLDTIPDLAHHFFSRCLEADIVPYICTKKTVFKWQEEFWSKMKDVFDADYRDKFRKKGLLNRCDGELCHLISDAAQMKLIAWTGGGFGIACHNYDGDMLTDALSQVHRSPGFISSALIGQTEGKEVAEFEASHGTVADMHHARLKGEETSLNPLGMVFALKEALRHSAKRENQNVEEIEAFASKLWAAMCKIITSPKGTRDVAGENGSTTEEFITLVAEELKKTA